MGDKFKGLLANQSIGHYLRTNTEEAMDLGVPIGVIRMFTHHNLGR